MIAVSSPRPHAGSPMYAKHQRAALESWLKVFDAVFYYGNEEPELTDSNVRWVPLKSGETHPKIGDMMEFLGANSQWGCIINADIIVTEKLTAVVAQMERKSIHAAVSKRWNFDADDRSTAKVTDKGLDIFIARPYLWRSLAKMIHSGYRIGHCEWDTWVLGMLMRLTHRKMGDFTQSKCVFHPVHEGQLRPLNPEVPKMDDEIYLYAKMPTVKIAL